VLTVYFWIVNYKNIIFLSGKGLCYGIGDNSNGQLGSKDGEILYSPNKVNINEEKQFVKISAGFQHSLFLTIDGEVYGCGKCDKNQLGGEILAKYTNKSNLRGRIIFLN